MRNLLELDRSCLSIIKVQVKVSLCEDHDQIIEPGQRFCLTSIQESPPVSLFVKDFKYASPLPCFAVGKVHLEVVGVDVEEEDSVIPVEYFCMKTKSLLS